MSLGLHPSCISRLTQLLSESISQIEVLYGIFLKWSTSDLLGELDRVLPRRDGKQVHPGDFIEDRPASEFCIDQLQRMLDVHGNFENSGPLELKALTDNPKFSEPAICAQEIVSLFETLPWNYIFSMRLPRLIGMSLAHILSETGRQDITTDIWVVTDKAFPFPREAPGPDAGQNALMLYSRLDPRWYPSDGTFLQFTSQGYVNKSGSTSAAIAAIETLQSFIGLGVALRIFNYSTIHVPGANPQPFVHSQVHRYSEGAYVFDTTFSFDPSMMMVLDGFELVQYGPDFPMHLAINHAFEKMAICYSRPKEAERVIRSAQWLAKSFMSRNGTMSFVEGMIALEILLGDKNSTDIVGISALLSNRCAYLIGESQADRENILADFRSLYSVRSSIVHSGKSRLSRTELAQLFQLRHICERAIRAEIELIAKNST